MELSKRQEAEQGRSGEAGGVFRVRGDGHMGPGDRKADPGGMTKNKPSPEGWKAAERS